ncbi:MAG: ATP-grasp domain-containing protein [Cellvibrionales bacterium]|nr:ATP-grasp domain-containing protein [Cellvibrionales bacterium]
MLLFAHAEQRAKDHALNNRKQPYDWHRRIAGLRSVADMEREIGRLKKLDVDGYIERVLAPAEVRSRPSAKTVVRKLRGRVHGETEIGPYYAIELDLSAGGDSRRVGILAQNRAVGNGVWGPAHHLEAARQVRAWARRRLPIVTLMDTPGADAGQQANAANQAHSISRLIAEMSRAAVPTIGIIYGLGYSGGAIPLAATNVLLATNSAVFNTIQPKGLASIAQQYNLSWQESARYVGLSPCELFAKGAVDGVLDWGPEAGDAQPLAACILSALEAVEGVAREVAVALPELAPDYQRSVERALQPRERLAELERAAEFAIHDRLTEFPSLFDHCMAYMRYMSMRVRISSGSVESYGRLAEEEIPAGDLSERLRTAREAAFERWYQDPDKLVYQEPLHKAWGNYRSRQADLAKERGHLTTMLLGDPQKNFDEARKQLCFQVALYLYNRWKADAIFNFVRLAQLSAAKRGGGEAGAALQKNDADLTILDLVYDQDLSSALVAEFNNILIFDALYNTIIERLADIAEETHAFRAMSSESLTRILDSSLEKATGAVAEHGLAGNGAGEGTSEQATQSRQFADWLHYFTRYRRRGEFLSEVEEWKRVSFPRLSEALLVLITFFFETLIPEFLGARLQGKPYEGRIEPVRIGKRKDFWNQLEIAYKDLLIQRILDGYKRAKKTGVAAFVEHFFSEFSELYAERMTANPVNFPGFRLSIEKALANGVTPCGVVAGIGVLKEGGQRVGALISNVAFQAGAFDMAGAEKLCDLLVECGEQGLPVVAFVSSGGMQTKEGPSALFSMGIANDRITRFIERTGLPVIVFGFGDCTGGSQASFVTHPLVHTYYLSGADMPFAGRVVVPSFLPAICTLANYLHRTPGAMQGLVKHPFADGLDDKLRAVDPDISVPTDRIERVIQGILEGRDGRDSGAAVERDLEPIKARDLMGPIERVLIHARGCTAVKLIRIAQKLGKKVLLVQSDPDMESVAVDMLTAGDEAVSLGGQTPDESYLNGLSVVTIAKRKRADALHPGIGFLSENADFARLCRKNGLNVIGPRASSMDTMGNKSNAIQTSMECQVPVVPGSHGILTSAEATARVAEEVGYPVLLKAVHGGGGKGIKVVRGAEEVRDAFNSVFVEARSAFGNGDLYLEKFVESMRHIEVQILRDSAGNTRILGLRDCTVQRNNQKVLEESGSTMLSKKLQKVCYDSAQALADAVDYIGAGTVEFIYDMAGKCVYFMEMNTRLQVEHPVTEWTSGVSIVSEQFRIAEGGSIADLEVAEDGFAIEARITAEKAVLGQDGTIDFRPTPGQVTECHFPQREHMELIAAVDAGKVISPFYDSMIAQLIVHGADRNEAIARLLEVLENSRIKGVCTNMPLLQKILTDEVFVGGKYDTKYLPGLLERLDKAALVEEMAYTGVAAVATSADALRIEGSDELRVLAPMTGIFYTTPAPSEPEYAPVGSRKAFTDTLCQIEAMKLFTQISLASVQGAGDVFGAELSYEVVRVNQASGAQVNAGDLLFVVRPRQP